MNLNVFYASNLWHIFRVLQPPKDWVDRLQKCFVNFVWQGSHWTKENILSLPNILLVVSLVTHCSSTGRYTPSQLHGIPLNLSRTFLRQHRTP